MRQSECRLLCGEEKFQIVGNRTREEEVVVSTICVGNLWVLQAHVKQVCKTIHMLWKFLVMVHVFKVKGNFRDSNLSNYSVKSTKKTFVLNWGDCFQLVAIIFNFHFSFKNSKAIS